MKKENFDKEKIKKEYFQSQLEGRRKRRLSIIKKILIIVSIFILFKLIIGHIVIPNPLPYNQNRLYEVRLNGTPVNVEVIDTYSFPIIPFILHFESYRDELYNFNEQLPGNDYDVGYHEEKYFLNIKTYTCYTRHSTEPVSCNIRNENLKKVENDDKNVKYYLKIRKGWSNYIYDGTFISDISSYLKENDYYRIEIIAKYGFVESDINFYIRTY